MKQKPRSPFLLKPYTKMDGWFLICIFGFYFCLSFYQLIKQKDLTFVWIMLASLLAMIVFRLFFKHMYKSLLLQNNTLTVINWLGKNLTYNLADVKGYCIKEEYLGKGLTGDVTVIILKNGAQIKVMPEYYYDDKLKRLLAALNRYNVSFLGKEELPESMRPGKFTIYAFAILSFTITTLLFLARLKRLG